MGTRWVPALVAALLAAVWLSVTRRRASARQHKVFTIAELALHDGEQRTPTLLSIMGEVFDVSAGPEFYNKGGGYAHFAARDATLAFVTGEFERDLTDDVSSLRPAQLADIANWVNETYHAKYIHVGVLGGGYFYDASGARTPAAFEFDAAVVAERDRKALRARDVEAFSRCSSRRTRTQHYVWCAPPNVPRRRKTHFDDDERCACVDAPIADADPESFAIYEGCPHDSKCFLPLPAT